MIAPFHNPRISVVVPARNAGADVARLVAALAAQTVGRAAFEVVLVDDGSTDGSTDGIETDDGWLRVLTCPPANPYAARNRGAGEARGRALAFCDADCRPEADWLERGLAALEHADLAAGIVRFTTPEPARIWALVDMETFMDQERAVKANRAVTANLFVRRDLFERLRGFDASLANGGDHEFVSRAVRSGACLLYAPDAGVYHPARSTAGSFLGKLWTVNRRHGVRESRDGRTPAGLTLRAWLPILPVLRSRRRAGRPAGLDLRRLAESRQRPGRWRSLATLPVIYGVVPFVSNVAQARGWAEGRPLRRGRLDAESAGQ